MQPSSSENIRSQLWKLDIPQLFEKLGEPLALTYDPDNPHRRFDCPRCSRPNEGSHSVAISRDGENFVCYCMNCVFRGSRRELVDKLCAKLAAESRQAQPAPTPAPRGKSRGARLPGSKSAPRVIVRP
jgi:hypothetical protein